MLGKTLSGSIIEMKDGTFTYVPVHSPAKTTPTGPAIRIIPAGEDHGHFRDFGWMKAHVGKILKNILYSERSSHVSVKLAHANPEHEFVVAKLAYNAQVRLDRLNSRPPARPPRTSPTSSPRPARAPSSES